MTRKALGRGLSALLPESARHDEERYVELDVDRIAPNDAQPRSTFREDRLAELAQSIKENGVMQPIVVRRVGLEYQIVAGERRWRAAQRVGLLKIPAIIRDVPDEKVLELALIENIQREDLTPIEEAHAYQRLMEELDLTQEDVAQRVGKDRATVSNTVRLLRLPLDVQKLVEERRISMGHARALIALNGDALQRRAAQVIVEKGLSVRAAEAFVKKLIRGESAAALVASDRAADPNVKAAEVKLAKLLNTKVRISARGEGGSIEIDYYSAEDLERIYAQLFHVQSPAQ
jgi:ParB family chromosome partitioning protein